MKTRSITTVRKEIEVNTIRACKLKAKYEKTLELISSLREEVNELEAKSIIDKFVKSGRSFEEVMNFLAP